MSRRYHKKQTLDLAQETVSLELHLRKSSYGVAVQGLQDALMQGREDYVNEARPIQLEYGLTETAAGLSSDKSFVSRHCSDEGHDLRK